MGNTRLVNMGKPHKVSFSNKNHGYVFCSKYDHMKHKNVCTKCRYRKKCKDKE